MEITYLTKESIPEGGAEPEAEPDRPLTAEEAELEELGFGVEPRSRLDPLPSVATSGRGLAPRWITSDDHRRRSIMAERSQKTDHVCPEYELPFMAD
jgi:hypothetical protein